MASTSGSPSASPCRTKSPRVRALVVPRCEKESAISSKGKPRGHKEFEVKADTLAHAVSFLINNFEGVEQFMSPKYYQVNVGNYAVD